MSFVNTHVIDYLELLVTRYCIDTIYNYYIIKYYVLNVQDSLSYTSDDLMLSKANESIYESLISDNKMKLKGLVNQLKLLILN